MTDTRLAELTKIPHRTLVGWKYSKKGDWRGGHYLFLKKYWTLKELEAID